MKMFRSSFCKLCSQPAVSPHLLYRKYKTLPNKSQTYNVINTYRSATISKNGDRVECNKYFRYVAINIMYL